jgi:hypothetical protein
MRFYGGRNFSNKVDLLEFETFPPRVTQVNQILKLGENVTE